MGSLHKPKFTRAQRGRSVQPSPKPRRKPATPKPSKLRTAADVLRDPEEQFRGKSRPSPEAMAARLSRRKLVTGLGTAAVDALREVRDGVPATALRDIHRKLEIAGAVAYICAATLRAQAADYDTDVALCLQRCVGDELDRQMEQIDRLLGRKRTFDDGAEEDGGAS